MAVRNRARATQKRAQKVGLLRRTFYAILVLSMLGFFILYLWALYLWAFFGFETSINKVARLSLQQSSLMPQLPEFFLCAGIEKSLSEKKTASLRYFQQKSSEAAAQFGEKIISFQERFLNENNASTLAHLKDGFLIKVQCLCLLTKACFEVLTIKVLTCLLALPLFILTSLAGLIDGLNQRAIRRASLGRESTFVFHKSLPISRKIIFWVLALWLALPLAINPSPVFISLSILLGIVMSLSASRFKKYL